jgi:hypothetical protein
MALVRLERGTEDRSVACGSAQESETRPVYTVSDRLATLKTARLNAACQFARRVYPNFTITWLRRHFTPSGRLLARRLRQCA